MAITNRFNRFGDVLPDGSVQEPVDPSYVDTNGYFKWLNDGNDGFDPNCNPLYEYYVLPKGDRILRYGGRQGSYAAPLGTPYSQLALPYKIRTCLYNEYEVMVDDTVYVKVEVRKGKVGVQPAWPSEPGGGIQYFFVDKDGNEKSIIEYINNKALDEKEMSEWSPILKEDISHP